MFIEIIFTENTYAHGPKNYNMKNCIYMGESQQFRPTLKLYFVTSKVNP